MNVTSAILLIFQEVFSNPNLKLDQGMVTGDIPGWDSFKNVEILLACEEKFKIQFRSREIDQIHSIGDLSNICEQKLAEK